MIAEGTAQVGQLLARAAARLARAAIADAEGEAEYLLAEATDLGRCDLRLRRRHTLDPRIVLRYEGWIERRATRVPAQHVVGSTEFYGRRFAIDGRALIPRPETEGLVDAALALGLRVGARVADLGTGSGCIALTLALERPDLELVAVERSPAALALAADNCARLGVGDRLRLVLGAFEAARPELHGGFDAVVANPPYVSESEWAGLEPEVREHDPYEALVAGPTGLEAYAALVPAAWLLLRPGGALLVELGHGQAGPVRALVEAAGYASPAIKADPCGIPRVLVARKL